MDGARVPGRSARAAPVFLRLEYLQKLQGGQTAPQLNWIRFLGENTKKGWCSECKFREATSREELCLPTDAESGIGVACSQEEAVTSAGLNHAEQLLPRQRPSQVPLDAMGPCDGVQAQRKQSGRTNQVAGDRDTESHPEGLPPCFNKYKPRSCWHHCKVTTRNSRGLGHCQHSGWSYVPVAKFPMPMWLLMSSFLQISSLKARPMPALSSLPWQHYKELLEFQMRWYVLNWWIDLLNIMRPSYTYQINLSIKHYTVKGWLLVFINI